MAKYFGVDLSKWNDVYDYEKLAESSKFAMLRLAAGTGADSRFMTHYNGCKAAGIYVGVYVYSLALTEAEAREEAENALSLIKELKIDYPIAFDYEDKRLIEAGLTKAQYTAICKAFISTVKAANYYPIFYTNPDWLEHRLNRAEIQDECELWLAHWVEEGKQKDYDQTMWQFGVSRIDGVNGDVDGNYAYKGFAKAIRKAGLNKPLAYKITAVKSVTRDMLSKELNKVRSLGFSASAKKL